jgi:hypothetical protein
MNLLRPLSIRGPNPGASNERIAVGSGCLSCESTSRHHTQTSVQLSSLPRVRVLRSLVGAGFTSPRGT